MSSFNRLCVFVYGSGRSLDVVLIDKLLLLLTEHKGAPHNPRFFFCFFVCVALGTVFFCASPPMFALAYFVVKTKSLILAWIKEQKESNSFFFLS